MFWILLLLFLLWVSLFETHLKLKDREKIFKIVLLILFMIAGTRNLFEYNGDAQVYEAIYKNVPLLNEFLTFDSSNFMFQGGYEIGYLFINSCFKTLGFDYLGFVFIHDLFFFLAMYIGLRKYIKDYFVFIFFFLYKYYIYNTFVSLRQSITIGIFFLIFQYIQEKNWKIYFSLSFIAGLIHSGAFILFPLYFINKLPIGKRNIITYGCILIPGILVNIMHISLFLPFENLFLKLPSINPNKISSLFNVDDPISLLHAMEFFVVWLLLLIFYDRIFKKNKEIIIIIQLFFVLGCILTYFSGVGILTRVKDYFTFTYPIIIGYIVHQLPVRSNKRILIKSISICYCCICFYRYLIFFADGNFLNYSSWLIDMIFR